MKLEVGGTYLSRAGHTVRIIGTRESSSWPFAGDNTQSYREDGRWFRDKDRPEDLVERIDVPSMQEDFDPRLLPGTPIDIPAPAEAPVAVGWSGRFTTEDVLQVWSTYTALLMGVGKYVSMDDLIAERNVLLKELE